MAQVKGDKQSTNLMQLQIQQHEQRIQPTFGICFDIDGVIARGSVPIPAAIKAFHRLVDECGHTRLPVAFVTNSLNRNVDRAKQLSTMLGVQVNPDQLIQAQGPLVMYNELHEKFCLVVGQGQILEIALDLGFKNVCTVDDIAEAYPLLDVVDHDNRKKIASQGFTEKELPKIEAVVLLGEPKRWESALQILIDVLRTGGRPNMEPSAGAFEEQLPVVACNMDLQFMHRASMPRFGHGAFLVCLEALYEKITGNELQYTALVGKPSEITFRYAEHVLTSQSRKLGFNEPIKTMYLIGDTPDSDIAGSNLYQRYVDRVLARQRLDDNKNDFPSATDVIQADNCSAKRPTKRDDPAPPVTSQFNGIQSSQYYDPDIPASRNVPSDVKFHHATVEKVVPVLVCTGVYRPPTKHHSEADDEGIVAEAGCCSGEEDGEDDVKKVPYHGHRDFPNSAELYRPAKLCQDVFDAVDYILQREMYEMSAILNC